MTVASYQTIKKWQPIKPLIERSVFYGMSYGLSCAGYDIRIAQDNIIPSGTFILASTIEYFDMPNHFLGVVHDKSTWGRKGLAVQNTIIEPGWRGYLTIEISNHSNQDIELKEGMPIAQVIFHLLDEPTIKPYFGKYQNQGNFPQEALFE